MICDYIRDLQEFKELYNNVDNSNLNTIDDIIKRCAVCCFYDEDNGNLLGCIYLEERNKNLYLNGFSRRKQYDKIIESINYICEKVNRDVYSETPLKNAILVLRRANFKKIGYNIYKRSK